MEGATTIPNGSTLKRGEAVSIFGRNSKMMIWSDLVGDSKRSVLQTGKGIANLTEHNWVTLPLRSTCPLVSRAAAISTNSVVVRVVLLGYYKNIIEIG